MVLQEHDDLATTVSLRLPHPYRQTYLGMPAGILAEDDGPTRGFSLAAA